MPRDKHFKEFKALKVHIDRQLSKEANTNVQKLIKRKKIDFYQEKLRKNVGTSKKLWKTLKSKIRSYGKS